MSLILKKLYTTTKSIQFKKKDFNENNFTNCKYNDICPFQKSNKYNIKCDICYFYSIFEKKDKDKKKDKKKR
jgi:hypothetical protein